MILVDETPITSKAAAAGQPQDKAAGSKSYSDDNMSQAAAQQP